MALEHERLTSTPSQATTHMDRAKKAITKVGQLTASTVDAGAELAAHTSRLAKSTTSRTRNALPRLKNMPRWYRSFVYGFVKTHRAWSPVRQFLSDLLIQPVIRFLSSSLWRRILTSNLLGFLILVLGFLYLNQNSTILIEEKRRTLEVQAEMIAVAIASGASVRSNEIFIDTDKLPLSPDTRFPTRGDAFTRHEMSLSPEELAPILKKMVRATNARARVLNYEGRLIIDTTSLLSRGQIIRTEAEEKEKKKKPKDFWTRLVEFMIGREFEVYKDGDNVLPTDYPEVNHALQSGKNQAMILLTEDGEQVVTAIVPIRRLNSMQGLVMLSSPEGEMTEILRKNRDRVWPLAFVALLATLVTSYFLARTIADPMRRLSQTAENVSKDINQYRDAPRLTSREDEVGRMAKAFRSMTRALLKRLEASERFAADVAHELKNPLTAASSTAESLEYAKTPEQRGVLVQQIRSELKRLNRLITDVSSASRLDAKLTRQAHEPVKIDELLSSMTTLFDPKCDKLGCSIEFDFVGLTDGPVSGSREETQFETVGNAGSLAQVMTNLIDNAISFSNAGDVVKVKAQRLPSTIRISVEDQGPGIDEEKLETIFDRFYTYRPTAETSRGDNSGLGLNISREIVQFHGGRIWAENIYAHNGKAGQNDGDLEPQRIGAQFIVELPVTTAKQDKKRREASFR